MKELTAANYDISDMQHMFVDIRSANVRGKLWPVQIALLGIKDSEEYLWSSPIYPALSWPTQILDLTDIDLRDAPPASDVARETLERISRASGSWVHAEDPPGTKKLLDRLLDEANLGFKSDEAVIAMDMEWGRDGEAAGARIRQHLETHPAPSDPVDQVERLARAWFVGYPPVKMVAGTGNVFADLGRDNAKELKYKAELVGLINLIIRDRGLSKSEAADVLLVSESRVSALQAGKLSEFSIDDLMAFWTALEIDG